MLTGIMTLGVLLVAWIVLPWLDEKDRQQRLAKARQHRANLRETLRNY